MTPKTYAKKTMAKLSADPDAELVFTNHRWKMLIHEYYRARADLGAVCELCHTKKSEKKLLNGSGCARC